MSKIMEFKERNKRVYLSVYRNHVYKRFVSITTMVKRVARSFCVFSFGRFSEGSTLTMKIWWIKSTKKNPPPPDKLKKVFVLVPPLRVYGIANRRGELRPQTHLSQKYQILSNTPKTFPRTVKSNLRFVNNPETLQVFFPSTETQ